MNWCEITKDESFRAMHEIGHVLILEQTSVDWEYVTILSDDETKGGCVKHQELNIIEENSSKYVLIKMAGEAIIRIKYGELLALSSSIKYDREHVKQFLSKLNTHIDQNRCINRALAANIKFFRHPEVKKKFELLVGELVNRKTITRQEYLELCQR